MSLIEKTNQNNEILDRVISCFPRIMHALGLGHWDITIEKAFSDGYGQDGTVTHGEISYDIQRENAHITLYMHSFEEGDDIIEILAHEIAHIFIGHVTGWMKNSRQIKRYEEYAVTRLTPLVHATINRTLSENGGECQDVE